MWRSTGLQKDWDGRSGRSAAQSNRGLLPAVSVATVAEMTMTVAVAASVVATGTMETISDWTTKTVAAERVSTGRWSQGLK